MKICIDAGHYKGYNQGIVKSYYEGNVVWKISNLQKKYLEEYENVTVILTRSDITKDLSLSSRGSKAKGCDLFLSNHSNSIDKESVDRAVIIYPYDNKNKSDVLGKKLGKIIQETMGLKQNYQMYQRTYNGGEYYGVMRSARSVGCPRYYILEHGFHTNKATCNWLLKDSNLEKLAKAEVEVIADYYGLKKKNTAKTVNGTIEVLSDSLNVRKDANFSADVLRSIKKGTKHTVIKLKNGLYELKDGGWCSASEKYVKFTETKTESKKYKVTADSLNVREGRGTEYKIVGSLKKDSIIEIWSIAKDSKGNEWASFRYSFEPSIIGYVSMKYLQNI